MSIGISVKVKGDTEICAVSKDKIMLNSEYLWVSEYIKYVIENKADFIII